MARGRYDLIADLYDRAVGDRTDDNAATAALLRLAGEVQGVRIIDLACGQGRIARELARRGAIVTGVDISRPLLEKARASEADAPLSISYELADATRPDALAGRHADLVVCNFGLSDIDDLDAALATVERLLMPSGTFVFSILHPCFPGWGEDAPHSWPSGSTYYDEGWWQASNPGFRGKVGANHRMLSTYLNLLARHGLRVDLVEEPRPTEWPPPAPEVPVYFVARCSLGT
jgi:ubiquinone/menaquinone biosynthesis C-methylase UbiE